MENEEFLNILKQVNTLLDEQLSRLDSVERNNPKQAVYLQQIYNALIEPEDSCDFCFVLPAISVGGGSNVSCDGATSTISFTDYEIYNDIRINGELFENVKGSYGYWGGNQAFTNKVNELNLMISGGSSIPSQTTWYNQSETNPIRVEIIPRDGINTGMSLAGIDNVNASVTVQADTGIIQFCLAPYSVPPLGCPDGYLCFVDIEVFVENLGRQLTSGDTYYVPIALTPNGESITTPFVIDVDFTGIEPQYEYVRVSLFIAEQLSIQLNPYGLYAESGNNNQEFGITYSHAVLDISHIPNFYILDEGNIYSASQMPRGMPSISCVYLS